MGNTEKTKNIEKKIQEQTEKGFSEDKIAENLGLSKEIIKFYSEKENKNSNLSEKNTIFKDIAKIEEELKKKTPNLLSLDPKELKTINSQLTLLAKLKNTFKEKEEETKIEDSVFEDFSKTLTPLTQDKIDKYTKLTLNPEILKEIELLKRKPKTEEEFKQTFLPSVLWRLNNFYKIIDKKGELVDFNLNFPQFYTYTKLKQHPKIIILKSRQTGISTLTTILFTDTLIYETYKNLCLININEELGIKILNKSKLAFKHLHPYIKKLLGNLKTTIENKTTLKLSNNSSIYQAPSARSDTTHGIHISELGKIAASQKKKSVEILSGTLQTIHGNNPVIIESTMETESQAYKELWEIYEKNLNTNKKLPSNDFLPVFLSFLDDSDCVEDIYVPDTLEASSYFNKLESKLEREIPRKVKNWWNSKFKLLSQNIYVEYPGTPEDVFKNINQGFFYNNLIDPIVEEKKDDSELKDVNRNYPIQVSFDLGLSTSVLLLFQKIGKCYRFIYCYEEDNSNKNRDFTFYLHKLLEIEKEFKLKIGNFIVPHDIARKEKSISNQTRESILNTFISENYIKKGRHTQKRILQKNKPSPIDGINRVLEELKNKNITIKPEYCLNFIDKLKKYKRDTDTATSIFLDRPKRDSSTHCADAFRYAITGAIDLDLIDYEDNSNNHFHQLESKNEIPVGGLEYLDNPQYF